jgi:hypothetical protein
MEPKQMETGQNEDQQGKTRQITAKQSEVASCFAISRNNQN